MFPSYLLTLQKYIIITHDFPWQAWTIILKNSFSSIGAKIWNSIPNRDHALPKYKFEDILQNQLLDTLTQENTHVAVHTLVEILILVNIKFTIFSLISVIHLFYSNYFVIYVLPVILTLVHVSVLYIVVSTPSIVIFYFSYPPRIS